MKKTYYTLLLIAFPFCLSHGSDTLEDVKKAYERSMQRVEGQGLSKNDGELSDTDTAPISNEKQALSIAQKLGITPSHITTREIMLKNNEDFNSRLFHTLTASISMLDNYISQVKNDNSYEWTFRNGGVFNNKYQKLPLEGATSYTYKMDNDSPIVIVPHTHLYEIERQRISLDLTTLWTLFIFWKKTMFPNNSFASYNVFNANALSIQVSDIYSTRKGAFENISISNKNEHYSCIIVNMLEKINNDMPKTVNHVINGNYNKTNQFLIKGKIDRNCEIIHQKKKEFYQAFTNFVEQARNINFCLHMLQSKLYQLTTDQFFGPNLKKLYKDYQDFKFPGEKNKKIRFFSSPLNFKKLFLKPITEEITLDFTVIEEVASSTRLSSVTSPTSSSETILIEEVASSTRLSSVTSPTSSSETILKENALYPEEDEIIYDTAYWQEQNRYHEERKKTSQKLISKEISETELTSYEGQLYAYLNENIYKYVRRKGRDLIQELKKLKFKVTPNNSGNGSLHYVYPAENNPLFGMNPDYAEAYFNIHLPHDDGDIVPSAYFDFIKSGFSNVFGLTLERINNTNFHA